MDGCPNISNEMKRRYLERRKTDLALLEEALQKGDLTAFARVGHQLKGNAISYGFEALEAIAKSLEDAGLRAPSDQASHQASSHASAALLSFREWLLREQANMRT